MNLALRLLACISAGAALAAFLPVAHAASAIHGIPVPIVLSAALAVAAITASIAGRSRAPGVAGALAILAATCIASVSLVSGSLAAFVAGATALAVATGLCAAAFARATPPRLAQLRLVAWGAFGAACSAWFSVHLGAPWLGMHGLAWAAAAACAGAALVALRPGMTVHAMPPGDATWPSSLRAAAIAAALSTACVAWARALAATLTPTPTVFAAGVAAPLAAVAAGVAIGVWLCRRPWAARVAVPALLLASVAAAHVVPPTTPTGPVSMAFGGPSTATYASGVLVDVLVAMGPLCVLAGAAAAVLACAAPAAILGGCAAGIGAGVVLVSLVGAVPGANMAAAVVLFAVAATGVPRRPFLALGTAALVAGAWWHAWHLGPLPKRCGVFQGAVASSRWDLESFRISVRRSDGAVERRVDSIVVSGDGRDWHPSRIAAHLAAMLAPGARVALLAGQGRDEARQALLAHGSFTVEESDRLRPPLSRGSGYDLVLHRAPILATWGAGGEYARETYEAARAALGPRGVFVQEVPLRTTPLAHLQRIVAGFVPAFPEGSAWFARGALVLVGGRGPVRADLQGLAEKLAVPSVYADLCSMGVCRPWDFLTMYLSDASALASRIGDAKPLTDDEPSELLDPDPRLPFAYVDGLAWLLEGRQGVGGHVVAGSTRGERWLLSCRLERLRKGSELALAAQLKYEQSRFTKDDQEASGLTAESLNAATQALKIDPGDRYAYETLATVAKRFGQTPDQHAKEPPAAPVDPPPPAWWTFQPRTREKEIMWLLDRLDTERGATRIEALLTIESIHDPTVAALVAELAGDPDPFFRATVAGTIERLGSPSGARAMVELLSDAEWNVRRSAAQALGAVGGKSEVATLIGMLEDGQPVVRETAYAAIGAILKMPLPSFEPRASEGNRGGQVKAIREWWGRK